MNQTSLKTQEIKEVAQRYLDPTNDVSFKRVFATEDHKPSLISFLNAILRLNEGDWIKEVSFLPQEEAPLIDGGKKVVFDVKCKDEKGREFIVEMQNRKVPEFVKRSQYYVSHCYVSQIGKGVSYFELKPVVLVALSNFELFTDDDDPISYHQTLNIKTHNKHLKDLEYVFVELPKFKKSAEELTSIEDQWLYFLKHAEDLNDIPQSIVAQEIRDSFEALEQFRWNTEEYDAYVRSNIGLTDEYTAKQAAREEGKAEGREEGREEGIKQVALTMLKRNRTITEIIEDTGLSREQIEKL